MDAKTAGTDGTGALYQRILSDIRGRILSGEWPPGHRIPFEHELAVEYDCSRMTVNKAMSELARTGLIERRRRTGSFVRRPQSQAAVLEIHDIRAEVEALSLRYRYELVSRAIRIGAEGNGTDAGFPAGTRFVELVCRHFAGAQPFCLEERAISLVAVPEAAANIRDGRARSLAAIAGAVERRGAYIRAVAADEHVAKMLAVPRHSPCLVVNRRTWSADQPVTDVRLTYAGETHSLVARFAPQKG